MTARSAGGRPAGVGGGTGVSTGRRVAAARAVPGGRGGIVQTLEPTASLRPMIGRQRGCTFQPLEETYLPGFQALEAGTDTFHSRSGSRRLALEPGSDIGKEPRPID